MPPARFEGFDGDAFRFLKELSQPANCNKGWFDRNRERYQRSLVAPVKALVEDLGSSLLALNAGFEVAPATNKTITRINRDMRFARNAPPYKDHLIAFFARSSRKKEDAQLFFGLQPSGAWSGLYVGGETLARAAGGRGNGAGLKRLARRCGVGERFSLCSCQSYGKVARRLEGEDEADYFLGPHLVVLEEHTPRRVVDEGPRLVRHLARSFERLYPLWERYSDG